MSLFPGRMPRNMIDRLSSVLSLPAAYILFRRMIGGENAWRIYLSEYVKPAPGEKVLDIGCGPGDVLAHLPDVNYTGLDIDPEYIESAKRRFRNRGRFLCHDVGLVAIEKEYGTFNLVLATGVLHHLDDQQAIRLFELASHALAPGGRLVTYDGCYVPDQSPLTRWILSKDRGKFVRTRDGYLHLGSTCFSKIEQHLRHDLLRIPYTHLVMRCSN